MSDERASDAFDCINDPQIIANWNQTVIYVAHFIRNKSMMHAPAQLVQFNLINSYKKVKRTLVPSQRSVCAEMCIVMRGVRSADVCLFLFIFCEFLWMIAVIPANDIFHADDFWRLLIAFDFRIWFVSLLETDARTNSCPNNVLSNKNTKKLIQRWPPSQMRFASICEIMNDFWSAIRFNTHTPATYIRLPHRRRSIDSGDNFSFQFYLFLVRRCSGADADVKKG